MRLARLKFKGILIVLFIQVSAFYGYSQTARLVVFDPELKPFYMYLNGEMQGSEAKANHTIDSLSQISYQVAIKFDLDSAVICNKELVFYQHRETVFYLHKKKNGSYTIKYRGEKDIPLKNYNVNLKLPPDYILRETQESNKKGRVVN